jgi:hypothetical protein
LSLFLKRDTILIALIHKTTPLSKRWLVVKSVKFEMKILRYNYEIFTINYIYSNCSPIIPSKLVNGVHMHVKLVPSHQNNVNHCLYLMAVMMTTGNSPKCVKILVHLLSTSSGGLCTDRNVC